MEMEQGRAACRAKLRGSPLPERFCSASRHPGIYEIIDTTHNRRQVKVRNLTQGTAFWTTVDFIAELLLDGGRSTCSGCARVDVCEQVELISAGGAY